MGRSPSKSVRARGMVAVRVHARGTAAFVMAARLAFADDRRGLVRRLFSAFDCRRISYYGTSALYENHYKTMAYDASRYLRVRVRNYLSSDA